MKPYLINKTTHIQNLRCLCVLELVVHSPSLEVHVHILADILFVKTSKNVLWHG